MSRSFWIPVLFSCVLHGAAYLFFGWTWTAGPVGPTGVVSVDFVEAVVHSPESAPTPSPAPRSKVIKKKTVRDQAAASTPASPAEARPARGGSAGTATAGAELRAFESEVTRLIDARKAYPRAALARELEGRVVVALTLAGDGRLITAEVEEPCPFAMLNAAALQAVRAVAQFPPLPAACDRPLHLHVPIAFKISRR